jgi:MarR family transcriptional regulator, 2-MHQ and catechol-resistance regulon repressor
MKNHRSDGQDGAALRLWLVLSKAHKALNAHARRSVQKMGLCLSDFGVLEALLHKGPLPVNVLGRKVLLTSGSITTAVDRLERRGLVERRSDAEDRRARVVHLTPSGRAEIQKLFEQHRKDIEQAVSPLTEGEIASLTSALRRLGLGAETLLAPRDRT